MWRPFVFQKMSTFLLSVFFSFTFACMAQAIPPSDLTLEYDQAAKTLHIHMTHISANVRKHHIRRIEVFKNDELVKAIRLVIQDTGRELSQDVSVEAKKGDVLRIKAICNQAGTAESSITVSEGNEAQEKDSGKKKIQKVQKIPAAEAEPAMEEKKSGY